MKKSRIVVFCALLTSATLSGCLFDKDAPFFVEPTIGLRAVNLVQNPSVGQLAAFFCPDYFGLACAPFLGAAPNESAMRFYFEIQLDAGNNGDVPIPLLDMLLGLNLFEGEEQAALGNACISFCGESDPNCTGAPQPGACEENALNDPLGTGVNVVTDLIHIAQGGEIAGIEDNLTIRTIPPRDKIVAKFVFGLDPLSMLDILTTAGKKAAENALAGKSFGFDIPYSVNGNVGAKVPIIGRIALPYGPLSDVWNLAD